MGMLEYKIVSEHLAYSEETNMLHIGTQDSSFSIPNSFLFDDGTIVILYVYSLINDCYSSNFSFGYMDSNAYTRFGFYREYDVHIMVTSVSELESKIENDTLNFEDFKVNSLSAVVTDRFFVSYSSLITKVNYVSKKIDITLAGMFDIRGEGDTFKIVISNFTYDVSSNSFTDVNKLVTKEIELDDYPYDNPILVKISDNKYRFFIGESKFNYIYIDFDLDQKTYSKQHFLPNITEYDIRFADFLFYNEQNNTIVVAGFKHLITDKNSEDYCKLGPLAFYELDVNTFNVLRHTDFIDVYFIPVICDGSFVVCKSYLPTMKRFTKDFINVSFSEVYGGKTLVSLTCGLFCDKKYYVVLLDLDNFSFVEDSFSDVSELVNSYSEADETFNYDALFSTVASDGKFILILKTITVPAY